MGGAPWVSCGGRYGGGGPPRCPAAPQPKRAASSWNFLSHSLAKCIPSAERDAAAVTDVTPGADRDVATRARRWSRGREGAAAPRRGPRLLVTSAQARDEREQQGQERPDRAYELR